MSSNQEIFSLNDSSPDSLFDITMEYIVKNLYIITKVDSTGRVQSIKDDVILPVEICERLLKVYQRNNRINDNVATIFRDQKRMRLTSVKLRNSRVSDLGLRCFLEQKPRKVELVQCDYVPQAWLEVISNNSQNLVSLKIGTITHVLAPDENIFKQKGCVIEAPALKKLTIRKAHNIFPLLLIKPLNQITYLDLSECTPAGSVSDLRDLTRLVTLILHGAQWSKDVIDWIASVHTLKYLDISQSIEKAGKYINPNEVLTKLVTSLPLLESLDISGTNLAGNGAAVSNVQQNLPEELPVRCDIPGLVSRVNNPLKFLGLYDTQHGACKRHDIPAKVVSCTINY